MQAVVFDEPGHIAVTSSDIKDLYRGDHFEDVLREAIRIAEANASA